MPDIWDDQTFLVSCSDVLGELAHWAVVQSPWVIPKELQRALYEFNAAHGSHHYFETSYKPLQRSTRGLFEVCPSILACNVPTKGIHRDVYEFIDLDALACNIARSITLAKKYLQAHDDK